MPEKPIAAYIMLASVENRRRLLPLLTQMSMCLGIYLDTDSVFVSVIFVFDRINDLIFKKKCSRELLECQALLSLSENEAEKNC